MTLIDAADRRAALVVAGALTGLAAMIAATVAASDPAGARGVLGFSFPGITPRIGEVASILLNNLRLLAAVLGACLVVQMLRSARAAAGVDALAARALVTLCDAVLLLGAAGHVLIVGMGIGAHGGRMVRSLVPHGPFELAAFSLALALYLAARREPLDRRRALPVAGVAATLLAVGAVVEVYLPLP